jgi:zinc protease
VHPYRLDTLGEAASVRALGVEQLQALEQTALHPTNLSLCVVGDVEPDQVFALAEELFGKAGSAAPPPPKVVAEPAQTEPRRAFRLLDKAQAHLVYGFLGMTVGAPERHALDVLTSILSGQGGRLFVELRDKRSLAYSVSSFSVEGLDPGYFGIYMGTSPEKVAQALEGIRRELDKIVQHPVTAAELDRARRYLIGAHAIGLQKNSARAALIAYDAAYGVGADTYLHYEEQINAVTLDRVQAVAQHIIDPTRSTLAILGPKVADVA